VVAIAQRSGHAAEAAYEGEAAVQRLEVEPFDVLITDYGMEGISGPALAEKARALRPDIKVVLITGWDVSAEEFEGLHSVLKKPCTREQVQEVLAELVAAAN
jgi:CheY-like chemotaxis protein